MAATSPTSLLFGQLKREYIITPDGKAYLDQPGGNLLYAAAGLALWGEEVGLVARVGEDYPHTWIEEFEEKGLDTSGIRVLDDSYDLRYFLAYTDLTTRHFDDPISHFARLEISFPRALLGYRAGEKPEKRKKELSPLSIREKDIPPDYKYARAAHFCPLDYSAHNLLPASLRLAGLNTLTVDPDAGYMNPDHWHDVASLLLGLTAFLPSEEEIRSLFQGRTQDLWEMAEELARHGCQMIVIKCGEKGQLLYDSETKSKYQIPAYPSRVKDPTGAGDTFCGGFLAGFRRTYDPLRSALHGNVSASIGIEGSGPFHGFDTVPSLREARLQALAESVRKV
jgi:ribokinase